MQHYNARKRFGQNFLQDEQIIDQIIMAIHPQPDEHLVEIGPGLGALTMEILPIVGKMDAVELDRDLLPLLEDRARKLGDLTLYNEDVLKFDFSKLIHANEKLRVFGNLPYNISSPLLFHLIDYAAHIQDMYFMLQKEVAERLAAKPGDSAYGRLGVMVQYFCEVELLFLVPPESFDPAPKVDSAFVQLIPHEELPYPAKDFEMFEKVVRVAFSQRRKTLQNTLKTIISADEIRSLGIDPMLRPEQISLSEFVQISDHCS